MRLSTHKAHRHAPSLGGRPVRWVAAGLILLVAGACADDGGAGGGGAPPATSYSTTECGTCVTTACSSVIEGCQTDPGCVDFLDCLFACPVDGHGNAEEECAQGCAGETSSETARLVTAVTGCRLYGDGAACSACAIPTQPSAGPLNQVCEPRPEPAPNPCRQCYWDHCCDTWDACFAEGVNPECDTLTTCIQSCGDPAEPCMQACFDAHPSGVEPLLEQLSCSATVCASDTPDCDPAQRDECQACMYEDCADPFAHLVLTPEGFFVWICTADCGAAGSGPECIEACVANHPEAEDLFWLWAECLDYRCGTLC